MEVFVVVGVLVAVVISVVGLLRSGKTVTMETLAETLSPIQEVAAEAESWILAAEKLVKKDKIADEDRAKFDWVYGHVQAILPDIDTETLEAGIEAAVSIAKSAYLNYGGKLELVEAGGRMWGVPGELLQRADDAE